MKQNLHFMLKNCWHGEQKAVTQLPAQRRKVYELTRFEENSASDIAVMLNLSQRTVENHLRMGREEVRKYIRQCI